MFVRDYGFTITEHDPERPWIVLGSEHRTITLDDGADFFHWAHGHWPSRRWTVDLDPWQLSPDPPGGRQPR
jgi:hypothetical protein